MALRSNPSSKPFVPCREEKIMNFGDPSLPERFWDKCIPEPNSGCWLWIAGTDKKGYGFFWYNGAKRWAHRLTQDFSATAHHKCYVNCCVNPAHIVDVPRDLNSMFGHESDPEARERAEWFLGKQSSTTEDDVPF